MCGGHFSVPVQVWENHQRSAGEHGLLRWRLLRTTICPHRTTLCRIAPYRATPYRAVRAPYNIAQHRARPHRTAPLVPAPHRIAPPLTMPYRSVPSRTAPHLVVHVAPAEPARVDHPAALIVAAAAAALVVLREHNVAEATSDNLGARRHVQRVDAAAVLVAAAVLAVYHLEWLSRSPS
eukprot:366560-Chlamydomonas_euryale.AAC.7